MKRYLDRIASEPNVVVISSASERARAARPLSIIEHYAITSRLSVDTAYRTATSKQLSVSADPTR